MKIIPMRWADVPEGSIILCEDGTQREVGPEKSSPALGFGVTRQLGGRHIARSASSMTLVVEPSDDQRAAGDDAANVIMMFMRAGFAVEVLPG